MRSDPRTWRKDVGRGKPEGPWHLIHLSYPTFLLIFKCKPPFEIPAYFMFHFSDALCLQQPAGACWNVCLVYCTIPPPIFHFLFVLRSLSLVSLGLRFVSVTETLRADGLSVWELHLHFSVLAVLLIKKDVMIIRGCFGFFLIVTSSHYFRKPDHLIYNYCSTSHDSVRLIYSDRSQLFTGIVMKR